MGDLFWNKVFGALLAVVLGVMGLQTLSDMVFSSGEGGHHGEEEQSLNEWAQRALSKTPHYTTIGESGPDHAKEFTVEAIIGERCYGVGCGGTKQQAEQAAARAAIDRGGAVDPA